MFSEKFEEYLDLISEILRLCSDALNHKKGGPGDEFYALELIQDTITDYQNKWHIPLIKEVKK